MNKQRILNWIGGIWFVINLPIIPFAGSLAYVLSVGLFSNGNVAFVTITFVAFLIILFLSKILVGKFIKAPVILSLISFLYASLQLVAIQEYLAQHRDVILGIIGVIIGLVFLITICVVVIKAIRGKHNGKINN